MSTAPGETAALVALATDSSARTLPTIAEIEAAGGATALLERRHGLLAGQLAAAAEQRIADWDERGIHTLGHHDHPAQLRVMQEPPPLLWLRGELLSSDLDGIAVIGTRTPTEDGIAAARRIAEALARAGLTVLSGLAAGIDTVAHSTALAHAGRTVAVLGTGLDHVYPPANAQLQRAVSAAISQFPPGRPPSKQTFPARNALMSALARATVIVEAGEHSGARIQARHALAQGRPLFLMRSLLGREWARTLAPQAGVRVIGSGEELIDAL